MIKSLRILSASLLIALCCWAIYHAAKMALADVVHYPVKNWIEDPNLNIPVAANELDKAQEKIDRAIEFNPNNAEYYEYQARIYYLRAISNHTDSKIFHQQIYNAYQSHKKALELRPQWPYSWANLALMKSQMQQLDVEFLYAVNQAVKYGPWEIASNESIVQAAFLHWNVLSETMQHKTVDALERIYQQTPNTARNLVNHYTLAGKICPKLKLAKFIKDRTCKDIDRQEN